MAITQDQLTALLTKVARDGAIRAGRGLSGLMGQEIAIHVPSVRAGTKADACDSVGGEEAIVLGCYLGMNGALYLPGFGVINRATSSDGDCMCHRDRFRGQRNLAR